MRAALCLSLAALLLAGCEDVSAARAEMNATPAPTVDPANTFHYDGGAPAQYLGTIDGCRIYQAQADYIFYVAHCPDGHATTMHHTGGKASHPVQTL